MPCWRAARVDPLNPQRAELALLELAAYVGVLEAFLDGVLGDRPHVFAGSVVALGHLEDFLPAGPARHGVVGTGHGLSVSADSVPFWELVELATCSTVVILSDTQLGLDVRHVSDLCTKPVCVRLRFCLVLFLVRMCDLNACLRFSLPVPVTVKALLRAALGLHLRHVVRMCRFGSPLTRLLLLWSKRDKHPLPLQLRHQLHGANVLQLLRKTQQQNLSPLFEDNRPSAEEYVGLQFVSLL